MRILFLGDVVGKPGRQMVTAAVPLLRRVERLDLVVANAENAAGGSGLTPGNYRELTGHGVDGITLGDHIYRRNEITAVLESADNIVKPANYPPQAPGKDHMLLTTARGVRAAVFSLMGRVFMKNVDCPLRAAERVLGQLPPDVKVVLVDCHAEATSDEQLVARFLDGKVSAVLGTHTHVPTADEQILPGGTAFQCDVGMCGPHESILGRSIEKVVESNYTFRHAHFDVATGDVRLNGAILDIEESTGRATAIRRFRLCRSELPELQAAADQLAPEAAPRDN